MRFNLKSIGTCSLSLQGPRRQNFRPNLPRKVRTLSRLKTKRRRTRYWQISKSLNSVLGLSPRKSARSRPCHRLLRASCNRRHVRPWNARWQSRNSFTKVLNYRERAWLDWSPICVLIRRGCRTRPLEMCVSSSGKRMEMSLFRNLLINIRRRRMRRMLMKRFGRPRLPMIQRRFDRT